MRFEYLTLTLHIGLKLFEEWASRCFVDEAFRGRFKIMCKVTQIRVRVRVRVRVAR